MDFDVVLPHVFSKASGCGEPLAVHHIRQAAIEFCKRSRLWRHEMQVTVSEDSNDIIAAPEDAAIFEIEEARRADGEPIDSISISDLNRKYPLWRTWTTGEPCYITQSMPDTVRLVPSFNGSVTLNLFLQPSEDSQALPDFLSKYARALGYGALAEILLTPNKPFTSAQLADYYDAKFEKELSGSMRASLKGQQRARARTTARFF